MSKITLTVVYEGPSLRDGAMNVRDLAPALLAFGQLFDAANATLNGDATRVSVNVRATHAGSFEIDLELQQAIIQQLLGALTGDHITATLNLKELLFTGATGVGGVIWLVKKLRGQKPERIEDQGDGQVRLTFQGESITVPLKLLRLYQSLPVRDALQKAIEVPLETPGVEVFEVRSGDEVRERVTRAEAAYFRSPEVPDEPLIDDIRIAAFSIIALAFKEDNKWRLHDGNTVISASIADQNFLDDVNGNRLAFAKGDILICKVRMVQTRTRDGLKTDYVVEKVIEHRPAARQLTMDIEPPPQDPGH